MWPLGQRSASVRGADVILTGDRIFLRPARLADYDAWRSVRERNRAFLKPFEPTWPQSSLEPSFFKRRIERLDADWQDDRAYCFIILEKDTDALIGGINLNSVVRGASQSATFGYWLDEARQGQGIMGEAMDAVLAHAFGRLALQRLHAATLTDNERSMRLLESRGFEREGLAREYLQIDGERRDHVLFGLPKTVWERRS